MAELTYSAHIRPLRLKPAQAQVMLNVSQMTLARLLAREVFTVICEQGERGRGKRIFLVTEEVRIYAEEGPEALARYRAKAKGGAKKAKK